MRFKFLLLISLSIFSIWCIADDKSCPDNSCANDKDPKADKKDKAYKIINADELKTLIDKKLLGILIDARGSHADDRRISGALNQTIDAWKITDKELNKLFPDKNIRIICYCGGGKCPAGAKLAGRLVKLGYTNVSDYPGGIAEWVEKYPNDIITVPVK